MNDRRYTSRELAQMWNVSESTIKRWADRGELRCSRTAGGHRRFALSDICSFQMQRGFEATGLLQTEEWEDPDIEVAVNEKKFDKVRQLVFYLSSQNQRYKVQNLLERLCMRGMGIVDLYDDILVPVSDDATNKHVKKEISLAQQKLITTNLEDALYFLFPRLIRRLQNGKLALCAAPLNCYCTPTVNAISRIVEVEGWECMNLGVNVPYEAMAEMVEKEPVNLVCVVSTQPCNGKNAAREFQRLSRTAQNFRIPVILGGKGFSEEACRQRFPHDDYFPSFRAFRKYVIRLSR
ncbi:MAG: helix-turn-helix domain-containing protein [Acidobacteria bacterium]|nr:helix-turn-helix domain-containing protein [Acidobacteriota bacterium]